MATRRPTATIGKGEDAALFTFNGQRDVHMLPVPTKERGAVEFAHAREQGFCVRVGVPDKLGRVRRTWLYRYKLTQPDGKRVDKREALGLADALLGASEPVVSYDDALQALDAFKETLAAPKRGAQAGGVTIGEVWELQKLEWRVKRERTAETESANFERYLSHISNHSLESLNYAFWLRFVGELEAGRLLVGTRVDKHGKEVPSYRGPLSKATLRSVLNTVCNLYQTAKKHGGVSKDHDGAAQARAQIGTPRKKKSHIALSKIGAVWRASDVWCLPWARDQLRLYLLTGLRFSLLTELTFEEVDWAVRGLQISAHKRGTKRKRSDLADDEPEMLLLPLAPEAYRILSTRFEASPTKKGSVWYAIRPVRGRASRGKDQPAPPNKDPRGNWEYLEDLVLDGKHFTPHDIRRSFATIGMEAEADLVGVSLLMLHTGQSVADVAKVPSITVHYINTAAGQGRMRRAAEAIERWVLAQAAGTMAVPVAEPRLPTMLEEAVHADEDGQEALSDVVHA